MARALIVGAGGFVGPHLAAELLSAGYEVSATRLASERTAIPGAEMHELDLCEGGAAVSLLDDIAPDVVFHLAAISSVALSWKRPQLTVDVNVKGTLSLLEAVKDAGISPRLVMVGSSEEYGAPRPDEMPVREETYLRPGNIYAITKACQGMLGAVYAQAYGIDAIMVRAFNHIGPGQADFFAVSDFCHQVARIEKGLQEPAIHVGNLAAARDFTDVRDVVRAYRLLAERGRAGETYNVGSGHARSISSMLDHIVSLSARPIDIVVDEDRFRPVDVPLVEADIAKLRAATGWSPEIDIDDSIAETLDWWRREEEGGDAR